MKTAILILTLFLSSCTPTPYDFTMWLENAVPGSNVEYLYGNSYVVTKDGMSIFVLKECAGCTVKPINTQPESINIYFNNCESAFEGINKIFDKKVEK